MEAKKQEGFKLKLSICKFAKSEVKDDTITPEIDNKRAIRDISAPQNRKQVRQFSGKVNFVRKYILKMTEISEPIHNQLRKDMKFQWTNECQKAFDNIKNILCSEPILAMFNPKVDTFLYTDASIISLGATLKQIHKKTAQLSQ